LHPHLDVQSNGDVVGHGSEFCLLEARAHLTTERHITPHPTTTSHSAAKHGAAQRSKSIARQSIMPRAGTWRTTDSAPRHTKGRTQDCAHHKPDTTPHYTTTDKAHATFAQPSLL